MAEVGVGWVRLLPSFQGFQAKASAGLKSGLAGASRDAGAAAGRDMAGGVSDGLGRSDGKIRGAASRFGDIFKAGLATAGIAAGALLASGVIGAFEQERAEDKLAAQLGGGEFAEQAGEVAGRLYGDAFGDSVAETADAVKQVLQSGIMAGAEDMSSDALEEMTATALTFSDVLDQDLGMSLQAVDRMLATGLASSADEAFDILTAGIQNGVDASGDLTETFQEYSTIFRDIGLDGAEATGLLMQGLQGGARDADTVADALKEFAIRAQDGSKASAEGFAAIGLSAEEMTAAVAKGGPEAREALDRVLEGLNSMEDPAERNAAAVALFGTKAEDLGDALFELDLDAAAAAMDGSAGSTEALGSAYDNAATRIEAFKRNALQKIAEFIGNRVIPAVEGLAEVLGPVLGAAFGILSGFLGPAVEQFQAFWNTLTSGFTEDEGTPIELLALGIRDAMAEILPALSNFVDFLTTEIIPAVQGGIQLMADLWAAHGADVMAAIGQVVTIVVDALALIVAAITVGVEVAKFIWRNFGDEIVAAASIAWGLISGVVQGALDIVQGIIRTATAVLRGDWSAAWDGIKQIVSGAWEIIKTLFRTGFATIGLAARVGWRLISVIFRTAIDTVKNFVKASFDKIVGFFRAFPGRVRSAFSSLASAISSPFRSAFNAIRRLWNSTAGGFGFSIPDWIPKIGGKSFSIPKMHTGGIVPGVGDVPILAQAGEGVFTRQQMAALAPVGAGGSPEPTVIHINVAGGSEEVKTMIRRWVRVEGGGDVQLAMGSR